MKYILYLCTDIRRRSLGIRRRTAYVSGGSIEAAVSLYSLNTPCL